MSVPSDLSPGGLHTVGLVGPCRQQPMSPVAYRGEVIEITYKVIYLPFQTKEFLADPSSFSE